MENFFALLFRFSFGLFCHILLLSLITNCRFGQRVCFAAWFGMFVLGTVLAAPLIWWEKNVNVILVVEALITLILYGGMYVFLAAGTPMRSLFAFSVYGTYFMFLLTFASCFSQIFFGGSHYGTAGIRTVFMALYWIVLRFGPFRDRFHETESLDMGWRSPAIFSCISCTTVYISALSFSVWQADVWIRLAVSGILMILISSAYLVAARVISLMGREQAARETEIQRKLLESRLTAEREFVAQAKAYRHDIRHHIALLDDYITRQEYARAKDYLLQYQAQLDSAALDSYCDNHVADALLRLTARRCKEEGIPFSVQTAIPQEMSVNGPEFAIVLGNILENAREAVQGLENPQLSVAAWIRNGSLLIEVKNSVSGPVRMKDDWPVTTKPGGGQGLKSIRRVLDKYDGMIRFVQQEDLFFTQVVIPL